MTEMTKMTLFLNCELILYNRFVRIILRRGVIATTDVLIDVIKK